HRPILLATLGGLAIGLLSMALPKDFPVTTLFWGEHQIPAILHSGPTIIALYGVAAACGLLVLLAVVKMLAVGATLHSGFRGGFIFPLFFIGAALGLALSIATHAWFSPAVAMLCLMAGINVAVTRTPLSTTVILTTLSGTSLVPIIGAASLVSFLLTTRVTLIHSQRSRHPHPSLRARRRRALPDAPAGLVAEH
ncbi:MAG TPA: chloride channel protein, partial [Longimicrobiaceae bacterium]|nr:chloride channel protein [Longimicrobiaceae bacterium]